MGIRVTVVLLITSAILGLTAGATSAAAPQPKTPINRTAQATSTHKKTDEAAITFTSQESVILTKSGDKYRLRAVFVGSNGKSTQRGIKWTSSNPNEVSVSSHGVVKAHVAVGSATITASHSGAAPQTASVIVAPPSHGTIIVPTPDVVSASSNQAVLQDNSATAGIAPGDIVVGGSGSGLLASVTRVEQEGSTLVLSTTSASLPSAFQQLNINVKSTTTQGVMTVANGHASVRLRNAADDDGLQLVPGDSFSCETPPDDDQTPEPADDPPADSPVSLSYAGPSISYPVSLNLVAELQTSGSAVQYFSLGVQATIPITIETGSLTYGFTADEKIECTSNLDPIDIPTPLWIGPVEIDGTVTPVIGVDAEASASAMLTVTGPTLASTLSATAGIDYSDGTWQTLSNFPTPSLQFTPAGTSVSAGVSVSVSPFFELDAGFSASLGGVWNILTTNVAYVRAEGDFDLSDSLNSSLPNSMSPFLYTVPSWSATLKLSAGPELMLSGPVADLFQDMGVQLPTFQWDAAEVDYAIASSPSLSVSTSASDVTAGQPVTLTASLTSQTLSYSGDAVQFEGFLNGETTMPSTPLAIAIVEGDTSSAIWTPTTSGTYQIVAFVEDPNLGSFGLSYPSINDAQVTVTPVSSVNVTFDETGLSSGSWSVDLNGYGSLTEPEGTPITFTNVTENSGPSYSASASQSGCTGNSSSVSVGTTNVTQPIGFTCPPTTSSVTFDEIGVPANQSWSVSLNGYGSMSATATASGNSVTVTGVGDNGSYGYSASSTGCTVNGGTATVGVSNITLTVTFDCPFDVGFSAEGISSCSPTWSVSLQNTGTMQTYGPESCTSGEPYTIEFLNIPGESTYSFSISPPSGSGLTASASPPSPITVNPSNCDFEGMALCNINVTFSPPPCTTPSISSVGTFSSASSQTVVISGSCFGSQSSYSNSPNAYLRVTDNTQSWTGCRTNDEVLCSVSAWTNTSITFTGFDDAGPVGSSAGYRLDPGDQLAVTVWNPTSDDQSNEDETTISGSCTPSISSVGTFDSEASQQVVISGDCFGSSSLSNSVSAYLRIADNTKAWAACHTNDAITCSVSTWIGTKVVFTGFSGPFGTSSYLIGSGDQMAINVWNPSFDTESPTYTGTAETAFVPVKTKHEARRIGRSVKGHRKQRRQPAFRDRLR
jgi:hypothetical protein